MWVFLLAVMKTLVFQFTADVHMHPKNFVQHSVITFKVTRTFAFLLTSILIVATSGVR